MTDVGSAGGSEAAADDLAALAAGVAAKEAQAPKGPETTAALVSEALRRRAAGEGYASIGRALDVPAKRVSSWCRQAAAAAPASPVAAVADAAKAKRKRVRAVTRSAPVAARFSPKTYERLQRRAGSSPVSSVVVKAVESYLSTVPIDTAAVMSVERRRLLVDGLIAAGNALGDVEQQFRIVGRLENQLVKYVVSKGEPGDLPVELVTALAEQREAMVQNAAKLDAVRSEFERLRGEL